MWFRLDGLTPDEYLRQRADRWYQTVMIRNAIAEGLQLARTEAASYQSLAKARAGMVG